MSAQLDDLLDRADNLRIEIIATPTDSIDRERLRDRLAKVEAEIREVVGGDERRK